MIPEATRCSRKAKPWDRTRRRISLAGFILSFMVYLYIIYRVFQ